MSATKVNGKTKDTPEDHALEDGRVKYVPLGEQDEITLTPTMLEKFGLSKMGGVPAYPGRDEATKFLSFCRSRRLNPITGDVILMGRTGRDGKTTWVPWTTLWAALKRAGVDPMFDGVLHGVIVRLPDGTEERRDGERWTRPPKGATGEQLICAWAIAYRKDRSYNAQHIAMRDVYDSAQNRWAQDPAGMLCKVAKVHALRETFPASLAGMYTQEEMDSVGDKAPTLDEMEAAITAAQDAGVVQDDPTPQSSFAQGGQEDVTQDVEDDGHDGRQDAGLPGLMDETVA